MITLVLDLDNTLFVTENDFPISAMNHHIYSSWFELSMTWQDVPYFYKAAVLNPLKLTYLLNRAAQLGVQLMFYTTGCWDKAPVQSMLKQVLELSPLALTMLNNCGYKASNQNPNLLPSEQAKIPKGEGILIHEQETNTETMQYVFVDDSSEQLRSLMDNPRIIPIHATTKIVDTVEEGVDYTNFYDLALAALERLYQEEQEELTNQEGQSDSEPATEDPISPILNENRYGWFTPPLSPAHLNEITAQKSPSILD